MRRTWTFRSQPRAGRPPTSPEMVELIVRLTNKNPRWGYSRIQGELAKLDLRGGGFCGADMRQVDRTRGAGPVP